MGCNWRILVLNGPNLQLLGRREPEIYGKQTLADLESCVRKWSAELSVEVDFRQSNHEGVLLDWIGEASGNFDGILINPAAYTHTSLALGDALAGAGVPACEVHLSNIHGREEIRRKSFTAPACIGQISGFGFTSYLFGLQGLVAYLNGKMENR